MTREHTKTELISVKKILIFIVLLSSFKVNGQEIPKVIGNFGYSMSWYLDVELSLLDNGEFKLSESSDISAGKISGQWSRDGNILTLVPTKAQRHDSRKDKWVDNDKDSENFFYSKIKILSVDRLFVESDQSHVHLNRLPTDQDGPYKIHFPKQKIFVPDSKDSVLVRKIMRYIKTWPYEHGYTIQLSGQTSEEDDKTDKYIGLKRCRSIVRYFQEQIGIGWNDFVIKDLDHGDQKGDSFVEIKIIHDYP